MSQRRDDDLPEELLTPLLGAITPQQPPATLRAKVLDRVAAARTSTARTSRINDGPWKTVLPGVDVKTLHHDSATRMVSFLLRAQPGASLPSHPHHAHEECLVLEGEFSMGDLTLRTGDYHMATTDVVHPQASTRTGVIVYLRASVDDYPFACP
ncbi:MAG: cupin domain-containing protein [Gammaproteobacteria bacterium]|nr:cupin domain-containing protein [Gammaproteobacteria bacterium]